MLARFKITSLRSLIKTVLWIYCYNLHRNVTSLLKVSRKKKKKFNSTESMELRDAVERTATISTEVKPSRNIFSANLPSLLSVEIHR